jgi:hypothetical protein
VPEPSPRPLLHHNPDFSAGYWRGMASQARGIVNRDDGRGSIRPTAASFGRSRFQLLNSRGQHYLEIYQVF